MQRFYPNADTRETLTRSLKTFFSDVLDENDTHISPHSGGSRAAWQQLSTIDPVAYCKNRNFYDGAVTRLSAYIRHGILHPETVRRAALAALSPDTSPRQIEKFIQELTWRYFWQRNYEKHPEWIWQDIEAYKTGLLADDYADQLPTDIERAQTGVACIDHFIRDLLETGYMHNHTRMYVASYVVHFRRIKWQAGARWFLKHLIDGDPASNNFSWQWIASTFSAKPYIFNLDNVARYCGNHVDCLPENNQVIDASYEALSERLFLVDQNE